MREVFVVEAKRTAVGNYMGSLASFDAHEIGSFVIKDIIGKNEELKDNIGELIAGQVLTGGQGQNPARRAAVLSGINISVPSYTLNKVCGSGLKSIANGFYSIAFGDSDLVIAGGQESMSRALHGSLIRQAPKFGDVKMKDFMIYDGLTDVFSNKHMGITAENVAKKYEISREEQDEFALKSQQKAFQASEKGLFTDEIIPVRVRVGKDEIDFAKDEFIRGGSDISKLSKLKPAFLDGGTVTAANASGINDGSAYVLLASREAIARYNLKPLVKIVGQSSVGVDPDYMGIGPAFAVQKLMKNIGWRLSDLDLIEANEAFAAQAIAVNKILEWNVEKVNVNGGAIAIGHPIGASGARIFVTLVHEMKRRKSKKGVATLCIGGGMGIAVAVELV